MRRRRSIPLRRSVALAIGAFLGLLRPGAAAIPCVWEPTFGIELLNGDDSTVTVPLGITFPFLGTDHTSVFMSTNGFLAFGPNATSAGSGCCDGDTALFLSGPPRIAGAWCDLVTSVSQSILPGRVVFTWQGMEFSGTAPHLWQIQLESTGVVTMAYANLPADNAPGHRHHGLIGVSNGQGAVDPGERDLSTAPPFASACEGSVYEFFARGPNGATGPDLDPWDLESNALVFTPDGCGGWDVTSCGAGCPAVLSPVALLLAAKSAANVRLSWSLLTSARDGYNVWRVAVKTALPIVSAPPGPGVMNVCALATALTCNDVGAVPGAAGTVWFYQAKGVCGGAEGP